MPETPSSPESSPREPQFPQDRHLNEPKTIGGTRFTAGPITIAQDGTGYRISQGDTATRISALSMRYILSESTPLGAAPNDVASTGASTRIEAARALPNPESPPRMGILEPVRRPASLTPEQTLEALRRNPGRPVTMRLESAVTLPNMSIAAGDYAVTRTDDGKIIIKKNPESRGNLLCY